MKAKKRCAIIIAILFMFSIIPSFTFAADVSLTLSTDSAKVGDSITASGTADPDTWVTIKVLDSTQSVVFFDGVKSDADGKYSCTFIVPSVTSGTLTVVTGYSENVAVKNLTITDTPTTYTVTFAVTPEDAVVVVKDSKGTEVAAEADGTYKLEAGEYSYTVSAEGYITKSATFTVAEEPQTISVVLEAEPAMPLNPPVLTADTTDNEIGNEIELTFIDDPAWRQAVTGVYVDGAALAKKEYTLSSGKLRIVADIFTAAKDYTIVVKAKNYKDAIATQTIKGEQEPPALTVDSSDNEIGNEIELTFTDDPSWRQAVTGVYVDGIALAKNEHTLSSGKLRIVADIFTAAKDYTIVVTATGYTDAVVTQKIVKPITEEKTKVDEENKNLAITEKTLEKLREISIEVPGEVKDANIDLSTVTESVADGKVKTQPLPKLNMKTDTGESTKQFELEIPSDTEITSDESWDRTIKMPTVRDKESVEVTPDSGKKATVSCVIEVGSDSELIFSKAVRLLIPGEAGKEAGFYRAGVFTKITRICDRDDQDWADKNIPAGGDAKIDVGDDLVIWTKHFTKFVTYTQETVSSGGGGGSGSTAGKTISRSGGTVSEYGVTVDIPSGAVEESIKVRVTKIASVANLPVKADSKLVSEVVEVTKDKAGDFAKPVTITLPFDKSKLDTDKYDISIYWLNEKDNVWVELDNVKADIVTGKVSGEVKHFTKFAVWATEKASQEKPVEPLLKDIAGHWAENTIKEMVVSGAVTGYPDGAFKPDNTITRAEFATVLIKAFKLEPKTGKVFSDTANHWAKDSIAIAVAYGIVSGYNETTFGPDDLITREQMAVMIAKAAGVNAGTGGKSFTDSAQIAVWAKDAVAAASENNIISGYPDNTFRPQANATRAEAVTVISRA